MSIRQKTDIHLKEVCYKPLALGTIKPQGWLKQQLRIQADGLVGHLDEFWPSIKDNPILGGDYEKGWERVPYWLDGLVPLAALLEDKEITGKVNKYMDYIIVHQHPSGFLGNDESVRQLDYDMWDQLLMLKVLIQYYEISDDKRVFDVMEKLFIFLDERITSQAEFGEWGKSRWFEGLIGIYWYLEKSENANHELLKYFIVKLHAFGLDWKSLFKRWPCEQTSKIRTMSWSQIAHVVNNGMVVKAGALYYRFSGDEKDKQSVYDIIEKLDKFHGRPIGLTSGDECFSGKEAIQGTELCAVVEWMYSLEILLSIMGDSEFGDRLEKVTFNAFPATCSPDMWSHQYDQQTNQIAAAVMAGEKGDPDLVWSTNGSDANTFGLEPDFGCCTANMAQGWPKFTTHTWMKTKNEGLAAITYAPNTVETVLDGNNVKIDLETNYPFSDKLTFKISLKKDSSFPLELRIPEWASNASVVINGNKEREPKNGSFYCINRKWSDGDIVILTLPMTAKGQRYFNNALVIERGPLLYSLKIEEKWKRINADDPMKALPHGDWEVHPVSPWNYALDLNEESVSKLDFDVKEVGNVPFSPDGAPISVKVKGKRLPDWKAVNFCAVNMPESPVVSEEELEELTLIPYGCTNLRITEFPTLK